MYFTCTGAIVEVRQLETTFHFLSVFVVSERKTHGPGWRKTQRECPRKLRVKSTKVWREKNRPVSIWRRALARKSSYFDKIAHLSVALPQDAHESLEIKRFVEMGSFVEGLHLLTAVSACCPGLALPLASKACSRLALAYVIGRIKEEKARSVLFTPSLGRVRRPCRGLEKFFPPVLQRCYSCSSDAQEIVPTGRGMLGCFGCCWVVVVFVFSFGEKGACPK